MSLNPTRLARLVPPAADARPDGDLLTAFLDQRDEAAFAELVRRHGPVVRSACRRILPDAADADDAFQAAFLVLVRRGPRLDTTQPLGPWMYRVAVLTARTLRRGNARRFSHLEPLPALVPAPDGADDARLDLDAALLALPEKYRTPLILCHLQGWSRHAAAAQLGCREGTLSSLLSRGLTKLKARLRGYDPAAALVAGMAPVPLTLAAATAKAAGGAGRSAAAAGLAAEVARGFVVAKLTAVGGAVVTLAALGLGAVVFARSHGSEVASGPDRVRELPPAASPVLAPAPAAPPAAPAPTSTEAEIKRIGVRLGGTFCVIGMRVEEYGVEEHRPLRRLLFANTDGFQNYLSQTRARSPVAPRVQVDVWDGVSPNAAQAVFGACRAAGYRAVHVRGRVPTFSPTGWREFGDDDGPVDLTDLLPPPQASRGGGGKAGRCAPRPGTCRIETEVQ
jgi:RNA polymerase sigma factor (sigma-70 family)